MENSLTLKWIVLASQDSSRLSRFSDRSANSSFSNITSPWRRDSMRRCAMSSAGEKGLVM